jgi:glycosidase
MARRISDDSAGPDGGGICGSGFAITAYTVSDVLGGEKALAQFREKLARRDIKLLLDFVPNHTAPDHPWVKTHPD